MKSFLILAGTWSILLLAGCAVDNAKGAAGYLPESNTYYHVTDYHFFFRNLNTIADNAHLHILHSKLPAPQKEKWSILLSALRMSSGALGLDENLFSGTSSVRLPGEKPLFRTTRVWGTKAAQPGLLWQTVTPEAIHVRSKLKQLPAHTIAAGAVNVRTEQICRLLEKTVNALSGEKIPFPTEIAEDLSGVWEFACLPGQDGIYTEITLPDPRSHFETFLKSILPSREDGTKYAPQSEFSPEITFHFQPGRLTLAIGKKTVPPAGPLGDDPQILKRLAYLDANGAGFFYLSPSAGQYLQPDRAATPCILAVLSAKPEALILQSVSDWDPVSEQWLLPAVLAPVASLGKWFNHVENPLNTKSSLPEGSACTVQLEKLRTALENYAEKHGGKYPVPHSVEGLRELLKERLITPEQLLCPAATGDTAAKNAESFTADNCSYIYVGGSTRQTPADFPLIMDWPLNHRDEVRILTAGGKIHTFFIRDLNSCRKLASFLQSRFLYPEQDFRRLLDVADTLDNTFLKGYSK